MRKYIKAYKIKDGIFIKEYRTYHVYSESELRDFCRQNGLKLKPLEVIDNNNTISYYAD